MDKVIHFEIPAVNEKRAGNFYQKIFGWKIMPVPEMNYTIVQTVRVNSKNMPKEKGAINGGIMKRGRFKSPIITIGVKNINSTLKDIKRNGGKVIMEKMEVGDMGYVAYFKDTEGNVIGLWE